MHCYLDSHILKQYLILLHEDDSRRFCILYIVASSEEQNQLKDSYKQFLIKHEILRLKRVPQDVVTMGIIFSIY